MSFKLIAARMVFVGYVLLRVIYFYFRKYYILFSITFLVLLASGLKIVLFPSYDRNQLDFENSINVFIPKGTSLGQVANILENNGILEHKSIFVYLGKISGYQHKIHAGLFSIPQKLPPWHLLKYLTQPQMANVKVTLPEGLECEEIAGILRYHLDVDSSRFMKLVNDSSLCREFGVEAASLEGYLLPETYFFMYQMDEKEILKVLVPGILMIFEEDSIKDQMSRLQMSRHQVLTLASIIEGEVVVDSERVLVSSVYHNRLRRGWLLGADPTIQYIIAGPARRLLKEDLELASPYNTYKYRGLPPGPINNPGKKSILAALFPADTPYMYFVATGNGGHHFSSSAAEHARWKANFDEIRKQHRRNQRNNK